jgi:hypothetical protein
MNTPTMRNHNGRFTSIQAERRRAWAEMRKPRFSCIIPGIGGMTLVEHLVLLQRLLESMSKPTNRSEDEKEPARHAGSKNPTGSHLQASEIAATLFNVHE